MVNSAYSSLPQRFTRVADVIRTQIQRDWADLSPPLDRLISVFNHESVQIEEYLHGRRFDTVNPEADVLREEYPFHYLSETAGQYYIASYLAFALSIEMHPPFGCLGTPCIHLISSLCDGCISLNPKSFLCSTKRDVYWFLAWVSSSPGYFGLEDDPNLISAGLSRWGEKRWAE